VHGAGSYDGRAPGESWKTAHANGGEAPTRSGIQGFGGTRSREVAKKACRGARLTGRFALPSGDGLWVSAAALGRYSICNR
jgi:hypothetical protein